MSGSFKPVKHSGLITATVMLCSILQTLDTTIANVALPRMQGSVSATQDQMTWVLTSYLVASAIMTPLTGWLAAQIGRKRLFLFSVAGFTLASALCGAAQTLPQAVLFRFAQGICGAALVPMSQAVLLDINPPERHGRAMAVWAQGAVAGPILGPILGGWLTDDYNWRWVFYINVPFGILALAGILAFLPDTERRRSSLDFLGFGTLALAIGAMQILLDRGEYKDWFDSSEIRIEACVSALSFYLFFVHSATSRHPFVHPTLFADRNYAAANVSMFTIYIIFFATMALLPPLLQGLLNYPVLLSGLVTVPRGLGSLVSMFMIGRLLGKADPRVFIGCAIAGNVVALWIMTGFSPLMDSRLIIITGFMQGVTTGLAFVPLSTIAFSTIPPQLRNEGTAMFNLIRNLAASIGISVTAAIFTRNLQAAHAGLTAHIIPFNLAARHAAVAAALATPQGVARLNEVLNAQASMISYLDDFKLMMVMTLLASPLLLVVKRSKKKAAAPAGVAAE